MIRSETKFKKINLRSKLTDSQLNLPQLESNRKLVKKITFKIINTFAYVAISTATIYVVKRAVVDTNAPVIVARFTRRPVTIRGRIAVQPGVGTVPVKSYPAFYVVTVIAIIYSRVTS